MSCRQRQIEDLPLMYIPLDVLYVFLLLICTKHIHKPPLNASLCDVTAQQ